MKQNKGRKSTSTFSGPNETEFVKPWGHFHGDERIGNGRLACNKRGTERDGDSPVNKSNSSARDRLELDEWAHERERETRWLVKLLQQFIGRSKLVTAAWHLESSE